MARINYWGALLRGFECTSMSVDTNPRSQGIDPTSDFFMKQSTMSRRDTTTIATVSYNPLNYSSSATTITELYARFYFRVLTWPGAAARISTVNWVGGGTHDTLRLILNSDHTLTFWAYNGTTMVQVFSTNASDIQAGNNWYNIEYHFKYSVAGTTTTFGLDARFNDSALGAHYSVSYSGVTVGSNQTTYGDNAGPATYWDIAEVCYDDAAWIGDSRSTQLPILGQGTYDQWTTDANRDWKGVLDIPFYDATASAPGTYATATNGAIVSWTVQRPIDRGISANVKFLKIVWFCSTGGAVQVLVRRNGVDTFYTPLQIASGNSIGIDISSWSITDTIEIGFKCTAAATQRINAVGCYVEHFSAAPAPTTPIMKVVTGTYVGTGLPQQISFGDADVADLYPDFICFMRTDAGATQEPTWWWDSKNGMRLNLSSDNSLSTMIPQKGGFILTNAQGAVNTVTANYSYIAYFDSAERGAERGGYPLPSAGTDNTNVPMRNASFTIGSMLIENEVYNGSAKVNSYLIGPGMVGDQSGKLNDALAGFLADAVQSFGTGTFQVGTLLSYPQVGMAFIAFRATQFNSNKLFALGTWTGDGTGQRTITVDLSSNTPYFVLIAHNQARARNMYQGGICRSLVAGATDTTAILSVAANSFTVHSNLNTAAGIYSYFVMTAGLDTGVFGVTAVTPINGPAAGGIIGDTSGLVTVTGIGFAAGGSFSFGGLAPTNVTIVSSTSATMTPPAHVAGTVTVSYTSPASVVGSLTSTYGYTAAATPNIQSSPPWQTVGQWAVHRVDLTPRKEGPAGNGPATVTP